MNIFKRSMVLSLILCLLLIITNCQKKEVERGRWVLFTTAFGSNIEVTVHPHQHTDIEEIHTGVLSLIETYDRTFNLHDDSSELSRLNEYGGGETRSISPLLYKALSDARYYNKITQGAFNPAVGGITGGEVDEGDVSLDFQSITLGAYEDTVTIPEGITIDLNAIVKGLFADEVVRTYGHLCRGMMVSAGGDIATYGAPPHRRYWNVEVHNPIYDDTLLFQIPPNTSVTTSGTQYRVTEKGSHIINPTSGEPITGEISATVFALSCGEADALATAMCVLGGEEGVLLAEMVEGVECHIVEEVEGESVEYASSGLGGYYPVGDVDLQKK